MKEEKNKLEEKIRNKIYNHSANVPPDMWSKIDKGIVPILENNEIHTRKLGWYSLADIVIAVTLLFPIWKTNYFNTEMNNAATFAVVQKEKTIAPAQAIKSSEKLELKEPESDKGSQEVTTETSAVLNSKKAIAKTISEKQVPQNKSLVAKHKSDTKKLVFIPFPTVEANLAAANQLVKSQLQRAESEMQLENHFSKVPENQVDFTEASPKPEPVQADTKISTDETANLPIEPGEPQKSILSAAHDSLQKPIVKDSILKDSKLLVADTSKIKTKKSKFGIEIFGSPDFYQIKTKDNTANGFANRIDSAGIQQKAWSAGLRLNYFISKNFNLKTGIYFSSLKTNYALTKTESNKELKIDSISILYTLQDPFNAPTVFKSYDSTYFYKTTTEMLPSDLRFTMLDIPLIAAYNVVLNRFSIGVNAGISFNILFLKKGTSILPETMKEVNVEDKQNTTYRKNIAMHYLLGLDITYAVTKKISLLLEPHYTSIFKPVTTSDYGIKQSWNKLGINAGLAYRF